MKTHLWDGSVLGPHVFTLCVETQQKFVKLKKISQSLQFVALFCGLTIAEMLKHQQQTSRLILFVESELESGFHDLLSLTLKHKAEGHI